MKALKAAATLRVKPNAAKRITLFFQRNGVFFLMLLPGAIVLLINNYLPMAGIVVAFKNYNYGLGIFGSPWVGFDNFKYLFMSGKAWIITRNTLLYNSAFILISISVPVMMAIGLKELLNKRMAKIFQSIYFLPYFLSWVVVSYLVFGLLSAETGSLNVFLKGLGIDPKNWYAEPSYWPFFLVIINTWKSVGYDIVVFMASICAFDKSYYEVATVEGASKWQQIRHITIPLLKPIIITLTLMKIGRIFFADFGLFYIIPRDSGVLNNVVDVIDTYVYRGLRLNGDIGMATAAGLFQSVVGFITIILANQLVKKVDSENSLF
ncbi:MAG: ABC transporter permease subunit [Angelakisella sp.]